MHMSDHFALLTDFGANVLFNTVTPYKGDSEPLLLCRCGKKGGVTVMLSLKRVFVHMSDRFGLLADFDDPVLFNTVKPYQGDSDHCFLPVVARRVVRL